MSAVLKIYWYNQQINQFPAASTTANLHPRDATVRAEENDINGMCTVNYLQFT